MQKIAQELLATLDTPRALTVAILMRESEWDQLVDLTVDPHHYSEKDFDKFKRDLQATDFLRKWKHAPTSFDREENALKNWIRSRNLCNLTSQRLRAIREYPMDSDRPFLDLVKRARKLIAKILGEIPSEFPRYRFGPGSTFERQQSSVVHFTLGDKLNSKMAYSGNWNCLARVFGSNPHLQRFLFSAELVDGDRFTVVPKNAKTFRSIAMGPGLNIIAQLGVGGVIRERLKRFGIDLDYGQALHAALARIGSKTGAWCTLDLEMASDTVTTELVRLLLPEDWFALLDGLRSTKVWVRGYGSRGGSVGLKEDSWQNSACFSSMGNGFTFELETLVFAAIACSCTDGKLGEDVFVYGDDIIVPNHHAQCTIEALISCGFSPNRRKTYHTSLFRESCGGNFFNGLEVSTYKMEEEPQSPPDWFSMHNGLYRYDAGMTRKVMSLIVSRVPSKLARLTGPQDWGDTVLHGLPPSVRKVSNGCHFAKAVIPQVRRVDLKYFPPAVVRFLALYGVSSRGCETREIIGYKVRWRSEYGHVKWPYIPALA